MKSLGFAVGIATLAGVVMCLFLSREYTRAVHGVSAPTPSGEAAVECPMKGIQAAEPMACPVDMGNRSCCPQPAADGIGLHSSSTGIRVDDDQSVPHTEAAYP